MSDAVRGAPDDLAWSWVEHLRAGGTAPWSRWVATAPVAAGARGSAGGGRHLPGAAQLELVRRLAERLDGPAGPDFTALADRALARSGPGRGPAHIPLAWSRDDPGAGGGRPIGVPPADPAALPAEELVRAGVGLLADLVVSAPAPAAAPLENEPRGRRRRWHKAFRLAGPPVTTAAVRRSLALAGHHEGGRAPEVVLLAEPLDVALAQVWSTRVQRGAPVRWVTFAGRWARRDQLPPSTDLVAIASWWADRVGAEHVHVVTGADGRRTAATAAEVLGLSHVDAAPTDPRRLSPAAVDLLRRLNRVLNIRLPEHERGSRLRWVASRLPQDAAPALAVPPRVRPWLEDRAARVAEALAAGGYAVHGDLTGIAPRHDGAPHPRNAEVLDLVLATVLDVAEQLRGREVVDR